MRVVHLQRRSFAGHHSIERVFEQVRAALPERYHVEVVVAARQSTGLLPRAATVLDARRHQGDVTHVTGDINFAGLLLRRRSTLLTVHDTEFLERAGRLKRLLYVWLWLRLPVRRAGLVTVPSDATRRDLLRWVRADPSKVRVVPNPVAGGFRPTPPPGGRPAVLLVGTRPNKNVARAAAALEGLGCSAVVVGSLDAEQRQAFSRAAVEVRELGDVDDEALRRAYEGCHLLLFPSTKEGFGIPVLEAQAAGRPVVTSTLPPLRDVAGGAACLVDPFDVGSIASGVRRVLSDAGYREDLVLRGLTNAARYSAGAVAARYGALYDELASRA